MKKSRVVLIIFLIIALGVSALCIWQWQNIIAVVDGIRYDEQQLEKQAQQSEKNVADYLESNKIGTIRPLTEEESAAVSSGEITEQDAVRISTGKLTLEQAKKNKAEQDKLQQGTHTPDDNTASNQTNPKNPTSQPETENNQSTNQQTPIQQEPERIDYDTLISEKVAQLYVVKANFYAEFNNAWAAQKAAFLQLPKKEQTRSKKAAIVKSYMSQGLAMEQRYDAKVDTIIDELKQLLKEAGRSTELADSIRDAYNQEKKAKKAQLINKYFG